MSNVQKSLVGAAWYDPKYQGAILAKGQRRAKESAAVAVVAVGAAGMRCSNCRGSISSVAADTCRCSIWDRGKRV